MRVEERCIRLIVFLDQRNHPKKGNFDPQDTLRTQTVLLNQKTDHEYPLKLVEYVTTNFDGRLQFEKHGL
jgi:hypothetical protein